MKHNHHFSYMKQLRENRRKYVNTVLANIFWKIMLIATLIPLFMLILKQVPQ